MKHACQYASRLASDSLDRPLRLWERLQLRVHLSICRNCRNCDASLKLMRQISTLIRDNRYGQLRLSEQQREQLHAALEGGAQQQK